MDGTQENAYLKRAHLQQSLRLLEEVLQTTTEPRASINLYTSAMYVKGACASATRAQQHLTDTGAETAIETHRFADMTMHLNRLQVFLETSAELYRQAHCELTALLSLADEDYLSVSSP